MNRKSIIRRGPALFVLVIAMAFNGCEPNTDFENGGEYAKIYMPEANNYPSEHPLIISDSVQTVTYGANYGGPNYPDNDVNVHFTVDPTLVDSFNVANGTNYELMPEGAYEFTQQSATIPAGGVSTDPLKLNISPDGIQPVAVTKYLLPVSVEASNDIQINSDLKTTYFLFEGHYVEFDRTGWAIYDVDSEQGDPAPAPATNLLDGDPVTFWHSVWSVHPQPPLPHHVTIDMGETHMVHGLRIIGRQGFTRGDPEEIVISTSSDGENFSEGETFTTKFNTQNEQSFYLSAPQEGQYFKLTVTDSYGWDDPPIAHIAEVYGF